jgi:hypothetical protein
MLQRYLTGISKAAVSVSIVAAAPVAATEILYQEALSCMASLNAAQVLLKASGKNIETTNFASYKEASSRYLTVASFLGLRLGKTRDGVSQDFIDESNRLSSQVFSKDKIEPARRDEMFAAELKKAFDCTNKI